MSIQIKRDRSKEPRRVEEPTRAWDKAHRTLEPPACHTKVEKKKTRAGDPPENKKVRLQTGVKRRGALVATVRAGEKSRIVGA